MRYLICSTFALLLFTVCALADVRVLGKGWHMVSLVEEQSTEDFLQTHPEIKSIWGWNGVQWMAAFQSEKQGTGIPRLKSIELNQGYWIQADKTFQLQLPLKNRSNSFEIPANLGDGWQFLGLSESIDIPLYFSEILPEGGTIWTWKNQKWSVYSKGDLFNQNQFNHLHQTELGTLRQVEAGNAFWVNWGKPESAPDLLWHSASGQGQEAEFTEGLEKTLDTENILGLVHGNEKFVAVGQLSDLSMLSRAGAIFKSTTGEKWLDQGIITGKLAGLDYGKSTFVSVGIDFLNFNSATGEPGGHVGIILTSQDGSQWNMWDIGITNPLHAVAYGNGMFVAVGASEAYRTQDENNSGTIHTDAELLVSSDAMIWNSQNSGTNASLNGITYGNAQFVAVGAEGTIVTASDGKSWAPEKSGTFLELNAVAYGSGSYVSVGQEGTVLVSRDAKTWNKTHSIENHDLKSVAYCHGFFIAGGTNGSLMLSSDAKEWTAQLSGTNETINAIECSTDQIVVAGDFGAIRTAYLEW